MASPMFHGGVPVILGVLSAAILLIVPAHGRGNCGPRNFTQGRSYTNCTVLPELDFVVFFSFEASNSSLSVALVAPALKSAEYMAYAVNLNGTGMVGAQALIAFQISGSLKVRQYRLNSYKDIRPGNLSFPVLHPDAMSSGRETILYATLQLPDKRPEVNHLWQLGPVRDGKPMMHSTAPANLKTKQTLALTGGTAEKNGTANGSGPSNGAGGPSPKARDNISVSFGLALFLVGDLMLFR